MFCFEHQFLTFKSLCNGVHSPLEQISEKLELFKYTYAFLTLGSRETVIQQAHQKHIILRKRLQARPWCHFIYSCYNVCAILEI